jgi:hypothetical protein
MYSNCIVLIDKFELHYYNNVIMSDTHNQPPQESGDGVRGFALNPTGVHHTQEGSFVTGEVIKHNMSNDEVRDVLANDLGVDPERMKIGDEITEKRTGRNMASAAFGRWNSTWETEADREKRQNAHLN